MQPERKEPVTVQPQPEIREQSWLDAALIGAATLAMAGICAEGWICDHNPMRATADGGYLYGVKIYKTIYLNQPELAAYIVLSLTLIGCFLAIFFRNLKLLASPILRKSP